MFCTWPLCRKRREIIDDYDLVASRRMPLDHEERYNKQEGVDKLPTSMAEVIR